MNELPVIGGFLSAHEKKPISGSILKSAFPSLVVPGNFDRGGPPGLEIGWCLWVLFWFVFAVKLFIHLHIRLSCRHLVFSLHEITLSIIDSLEENKVYGIFFKQLDTLNKGKWYFRRKRYMELKRVKQILSSSADIEVKYRDTSVWIDEVMEDGQTAVVHLRGPLEERSQVSIADLQEG
jgi:small acid-soluble spore protein H (minor)